jgi:hypothetical protein
MKKMFKLLMCAAIVAAGFTACSEEVTPIDPNNPSGTDIPVVEGQETMATFALQFGPSTRAMDAYPNNESSTVTEFRVLLFDAVTGALELDTVKTMASNDSLMTAKVLSGQKYVYVIANDGTSTSIMGLPAKGSVGDFASLAYNAAFTVGSNTPAPADLAGLRALIGTKLVYASTTADHTITLAPGITAAQSQTEDPTLNYVNVGLERAVARISVTRTSPSGPTSGITPTAPKSIVTLDTTGCIDPDIVRYHIWGANTKTFPFQRWTGSTLVTPQYIPNGKIDANTKLNYVRELGSGNNNTRITIGNTATYYYVPENNPDDKRRGNITIAAVEAAFLPLARSYITDVSYNDAAQAFTVVKATANIGAATDFYYFNLDGIVGLPQKTIVAHTNATTAKYLAKKIVFHLNNRTTEEKANLSDYDTPVSDAEIGNVADLSGTLPTAPFTYYRGGLCYYRLVLGEQNGDQIDAKIRRNYYYDANISAFKQLGENSPNKLVEPEDQQEQGETYLSVHINIRPWTGVSSSTPI